MNPLMPDHRPVADFAASFGVLSPGDYEEFVRLQQSFSRDPTSTPTHRGSVSFRSELMSIIDFVDRRPEGRELRACATGLIRVSSYLCVNTSVLKKLVHRCKSSINSSLQQLGYCAVKIRPCDNSLLASALASLLRAPTFGRQWTIRSCEPPVPGQATRVKCATPMRILPVPILPQRDGTTAQLEKPNEKVMPDFSDDPFEERLKLENPPGLFLDDMDGGAFSNPFGVLK
jgi:hypothetical protein